MKHQILVGIGCAAALLSLAYFYQHLLRVRLKHTVEDSTLTTLFRESTSTPKSPVFKCLCGEMLGVKDWHLAEPDESGRELGTCSQKVSTLSQRQRVVSYTFYQSSTYDQLERNYFSGIRSNLQTIKQFYPGYRMRLYYRIPEDSPLQEELCQLACSEDILDICDVNQLPTLGNVSAIYPLIWRFLPALDSQVDLMLSRDLDSVITSREQAAVSEFLSDPKKSFHVMRDHKRHDIGILGGTWAAKLDVPPMRELMTAVITQMLKDKNAIDFGDHRAIDQDMLMKYAWPLIVKNGLILAHDSYFCKKYPFSVGFPTQRTKSRPPNFVGAVFMDDDASMVCPEECRRGHSEWTHC